MDSPKTPWRDLAPAEYLASYEPTHLTSQQWATVKPAFVDLVLKCEPATALDASTLASSLARFLRELAYDTDALGVDGLVTVVNVANVLSRYETQGMSAGTRGQHRARLNRFLRARAGLSARTRRRSAATVRPLAPYSDQELTTLIGLLTAAPASVREVAHSALVLGIAHGVMPSDAPEVIVVHAAGRHRGRALRDATNPAPLRGLDWTPFTFEQWKYARSWLTENAPDGLRLHEARLRDTWLVGAAQDPASPVTMVALIRDYGIGRCAIEQLAAHGLDDSQAQQRHLMRDF